ncbi:MAG: glycosyltransferase, partial [Blastocatellia bacterium]
SDAFVLPIDIGVQMNNSSFAAAASHGLPIIATRGDKLEEQFVHQENVYLCEPQDPDAMATAIKVLMHDSDLRTRLAEGALRLSEFWFSWEKVIERTFSTLKEVGTIKD